MGSARIGDQRGARAGSRHDYINYLVLGALQPVRGYIGGKHGLGYFERDGKRRCLGDQRVWDAVPCRSGGGKQYQGKYQCGAVDGVDAAQPSATYRQGSSQMWRDSAGQSLARGGA